MSISPRSFFAYFFSFLPCLILPCTVSQSASRLASFDRSYARMASTVALGQTCKTSKWRSDKLARRQSGARTNLQGVKVALGQTCKAPKWRVTQLLGRICSVLHNYWGAFAACDTIIGAHSKRVTQLLEHTCLLHGLILLAARSHLLAARYHFACCTCSFCLLHGLICLLHGLICLLHGLILLAARSHLRCSDKLARLQSGARTNLQDVKVALGQTCKASKWRVTQLLGRI